MFPGFYLVFYYIALIVATIGGLVLFFKIDNVFRWISILLLITVTNELAVRYISFVLNSNISVSAIYHFFVLIEFILYAIIFSKFINSKKWDRYLIYFSIFIIIFEVFNTIYVQPLNKSNTNTMIVESVILVFLSLMLFLRIKESTTYDNILLEGVFWFNSSVLIYYAFNILVWGFHSIKVYNLENPPFIIYNLNLFFSGVLYLTFFISIYLNYIQNKKLKAYEKCQIHK